MRLSLSQRLGQALRGVPSRRISEALRLAEENGIEVSAGPGVLQKIRSFHNG